MKLREIAVLVLLCCLQLTVCQLSPCEEKLNEYRKALTPGDVTNPLNNAGLGVNDFGNFDQCLNDGKSGYIVYVAKPNQDVFPISYAGSCLPLECISDEGQRYTVNAYNKTTLGIYDTGDFIMTQLEIDSNSTLTGGAIAVTILFVVFIIFSCSVRLLPNGIKQTIRISSQYTKERNIEDTVSNTGTTQQTTKILDGVSYIDDKSYNKIIRDQKDQPTMSSIQESLISQLNTDEEKPLLNYILPAFDYLSNISHNFTIKQHTYIQASILEGVRAVTLVIIIFSNTVQGLRKFVVKNPDEFDNMSYNVFWFNFLPGSPAINSLFFISGFYMTYSGVNKINTLASAGAKIGLGLARLWFINFFAYFLYSQILPSFLDGPIAGKLMSDELQACNEEGRNYAAIFFYSVFTSSGNSCFEWSWIIQAEFYFLIVGTITVYIYTTFTSKLHGFLCGVYILVLGMFFKLYYLLSMDLSNVEYYNDLLANPDFVGKYIRNPFVRAETYVVGLVFGLLYLKYETYEEIYKEKHTDHLRLSSKSPTGEDEKSKEQLDLLKEEEKFNFYSWIKNTPFFQYYFVILGVFLMALASYILIFEVKSTGTLIFSLLVREYLFAFGLAFYTAPLITGKAGIFGGWLSEKLFIYISRVLYTAVLITPIIIKYAVFNMRIAYYHTSISTIPNAISFLCLGVVISFAVSPAIEGPFVCIQNALHGQDIRKDVPRRFESLKNIQ